MTWLELLQAEIARTSLRQVAAHLGYSHTVLSQVCNGKYPYGLDRVAQRVMDAYAWRACPALAGAPIGYAACQHWREQRMPQHPVARQHWSTCLRCDHNPNRLPPVPEYPLVPGDVP